MIEQYQYNAIRPFNLTKTYWVLLVLLIDMINM